MGHLKFLSGQIGVRVTNFHRHFLYHSQNISASKPVVSHQLQPTAQLVKAFTVVLYRTGMFRTICLHVYVSNATEAVGEIPFGEKVIRYPGKCFF